MNSQSALDPDGADFAAIEAVLLATQRGRLFLDEYLRRRRAEDAERILAAIDRIEARAISGEVERARRRLESERASDILRQLADVLKDLRPIADARVRSRTLVAREAEPQREPQRAGGLERRFAALVRLDGQDAENSLKPCG